MALASLTRSLAPAAAAAPVGDGEPQGAPLSGNIFKVLVNVGDEIDEGEVVMILEAMKMEHELEIAVSGTIEEVCVQAGAQVDAGAVLARVERTGEG